MNVNYMLLKVKPSTVTRHKEIHFKTVKKHQK